MLQAWISCMEEFGGRFAEWNMAATKEPILYVCTSRGYLGQSSLETESNDGCQDVGQVENGEF